MTFRMTGVTNLAFSCDRRESDGRKKCTYDTLQEKKLYVLNFQLYHLNRYLNPTATIKLRLETVRGSELKLILASDYACVELDLTKYSSGNCGNITIEGKVSAKPLKQAGILGLIFYLEHPKVVIRMIFGDPLPVSVLFMIIIQQLLKDLISC